MFNLRAFILIMEESSGDAFACSYWMFSTLVLSSWEQEGFTQRTKFAKPTLPVMNLRDNSESLL